MRVRTSVNTIILLIYYFVDNEYLLMYDKNMMVAFTIKPSQQLLSVVKSFFRRFGQKRTSCSLVRIKL